jgi:hypothetical protein
LKNVQISKFTRILPVETEFFDLDGQPNRQTDRQADRHEETNTRFS